MAWRRRTSTALPFWNIHSSATPPTDPPEVLLLSPGCVALMPTVLPPPPFAAAMSSATDAAIAAAFCRDFSAYLSWISLLGVALHPPVHVAKRTSRQYYSGIMTLYTNSTIQIEFGGNMRGTCVALQNGTMARCWRARGVLPPRLVFVVEQDPVLRTQLLSDGVGRSEIARHTAA